MRLFRIGDYAIDFDDIQWVHREPDVVVFHFRTPAGDKDRLVLTGDDAAAARTFFASIPEATELPSHSRPVSYASGQLTIAVPPKIADAE